MWLQAISAEIQPSSPCEILFLSALKVRRSILTTRARLHFSHSNDEEKRQIFSPSVRVNSST